MVNAKHEIHRDSIDRRLKFIHDLRNKLAPILIHSQLIQLQLEKGIVSDSYIDCAKSIEKSAMEMIEFMDQHGSDLAAESGGMKDKGR